MENRPSLNQSKKFAKIPLNSRKYLYELHQIDIFSMLRVHGIGIYVDVYLGHIFDLFLR